jgi:hypothetical protein
MTGTANVATVHVLRGTSPPYSDAYTRRIIPSPKKEYDLYSRTFGEKLSGSHKIGEIPIAYPILVLFGVAVLAQRLR